MNGKDIELSRRRVLGGIATVGAASAAAGAGTFAYFSDTETSENNTVSAGTLNLEPESGSLSTLSFTGIAPGDTSDLHAWNLVNAGTITGSLDVDVEVTGENDGSSGTPANSTNVNAVNFAKALEVTQLNYGGSSILSEIDGNTTGPDQFDVGTAYPSVYDLANNEGNSSEDTDNDLINLADPDAGTAFEIEVKLRSEAGNDFQADGIDLTFDFHLNQVDSQ